MCRKGPSMKLLDKEKWKWMRIDSVILPPHLFLISFSYQIVLIYYLLCLSVSLIWKCSFFRVGRPQLTSKNIIGIWTAMANLEKLCKTGNFCLLFLSLFVCVCVCGGKNEYTCNEDFCWWPCLFIQLLPWLFILTSTLPLWCKHSCLWYCIGNQIREQNQFKNPSLCFYFSW